MPNPKLVVAVAAVTAALVAVAWAQQDDAQEEIAAQDKAQRLREERLETLQRMVHVMEGRHRTGTVDIVETLNARHMLYEAQIDVAQEQAELQAAHSKVIENLREIETILAQRHRSGGTTLDGVLKATARRLAAEIRLAETE